jgi:hypothetical protein
VHGDDGDVLYDGGDIVQAIVNKVPYTIQKQLFIFPMPPCFSRAMSEDFI